MQLFFLLSLMSCYSSIIFSSGLPTQQAKYQAAFPYQTSSAHKYSDDQGKSLISDQTSSDHEFSDDEVEASSLKTSSSSMPKSFGKLFAKLTRNTRSSSADNLPPGNYQKVPTTNAQKASKASDTFEKRIEQQSNKQKQPKLTAQELEEIKRSKEFAQAGITGFLARRLEPKQEPK